MIWYEILLTTFLAEKLSRDPCFASRKWCVSLRSPWVVYQLYCFLRSKFLETLKLLIRNVTVSCRLQYTHKQTTVADARLRYGRKWIRMTRDPRRVTLPYGGITWAHKLYTSSHFVVSGHHAQHVVCEHCHIYWTKRSWCPLWTNYDVVRCFQRMLFLLMVLLNRRQIMSQTLTTQPFETPFFTLLCIHVEPPQQRMVVA